ncbi:hypothetical protein AB0D10_35390 [Kitasatospora sp. NPDC048545]|uniref:hypothetical protein n=1 Tax=Kitasatospora sp. NPDC048545 TaxID=3157208 RepID=UPI0033F1E647
MAEVAAPEVGADGEGHARQRPGPDLDRVDPRHLENHRVTVELRHRTALDGKVQRLYEAWGYRAFTTRQPSPHSPRLTAMIRPTH